VAVLNRDDSYALLRCLERVAGAGAAAVANGVASSSSSSSSSSSAKKKKGETVQRIRLALTRNLARAAIHETAR
jgi:hypothetical protein